MTVKHIRPIIAAVTCITIMSLPPVLSGEIKAARYRVSFLLGSVELRNDDKSTTVKNGDFINEGDILFVGDKSLVELRPEQGDASFKISGPLVYRCTRYKLAKDFSRNNLAYRFYSKLAQDTYHYYPRTIISAVRGEKDDEAEARNREQSEALKEAIDLFRNARLDESLRTFEKIAAQKGLQRHVLYLIDFYRAEILFTQLDYPGAMALYLSVYKTRNKQFMHGEIALCRAILCAVYSDRPEQARKLIAEYENIYGNKGAYMAMLGELKSDLADPQPER